MIKHITQWLNKGNETNNEYELAFYEKFGKWICIFAVVALISALLVHLALEKKSVLGLTQLDAQTLGNFFIFVFATSVAFAGALVVIKIASNQEELSKRQEELANNQLELARKTTPEYEIAHIAGIAVQGGIQSFQQQISLLFGLYYHSQNQSLNKEKEKEQALYKLAFKTHSEALITDITAELQKPWLLHLVDYEKEARERLSSKQDKNEKDTKAINLLAKKLYLELKKLSSIVVTREFTNEDVRSMLINETMNSLHMGVQVFYKQLNEVKNLYQDSIKSKSIEPFNSDEPLVNAAIHQRLMIIKLKPDFDTL